MHKFPALLLNI